MDALLAAPSPPLSASSTSSRGRFFLPLSSHGMPKTPTASSPGSSIRPHRFSTMEFPSPPTSPMSPPMSAKSFGTFIDSEPSTPAYSPRIGWGGDSSTLVLLSPVASPVSTAPSSPPEPSWQMMTPLKKSKRAFTKKRVPPPIIHEITVGAPLSSHPVKPAEAQPQKENLPLASSNKDAGPEADSDGEPKTADVPAAPQGKLARIKSALRRKTASEKKPEKRRRGYHELQRMETVHWSEMPNPAQNNRIRHSGFPTKTVLCIIALGSTALHFVDVQVFSDPDWPDRINQIFNFSGGHGSPLHFYRDREELDHMIQCHFPDHNLLRDPEIIKNVHDNFEAVAGGWSLSENEARDSQMPVTHGCRLGSNVPVEDYYALGVAPGPGSKLWNFWSVYDGHAGYHTAAYLHWTLIPVVSRALCDLSPTSSSAAIHKTIMEAFVRVDNDLMSRARHAANWLPAANASAIDALTPVFSGSCALMAAFDPSTSTLRVACTGDSRAVLGRWDPVAGKYTCIPLSVDQTGFNKAEVDRLTAAHPDEPDIIDPVSGRLLGMAVTRAFGDHRWKWDNTFLKQLQVKFWGPSPRPGSKTPPYMTAEPVVTETQVVRVEPETTTANNAHKSDFMILASDGLWDRMSSEHAVSCVSSYLTAKSRGGGLVGNDPQLTPAHFTAQSVSQLDAGVTVDVEAGRQVSWRATPEYFAIEDENAAVCLTRNALGGSRRGLWFGVLETPPPRARMARDDMTVLVVFFDDLGEAKGKENGINEGKGFVPRNSEKKWWLPWPW
ncbi:phosphatase 2C-like domain-containing protein [Massariosphaeria phaeospora]|uniref:Phosphatase 2C-like domain-containing protein n=1 Tax=Massariosphaeria phaeospora TaxID=100035 RepID=A0A7C8I6M7_9PLEO|nr:phosphatase 2C-like domain-containing protein [Massariosphaeria phaeospora]